MKAQRQIDRFSWPLAMSFRVRRLAIPYTDKETRASNDKLTSLYEAERILIRKNVLQLTDTGLRSRFLGVRCTLNLCTKRL